MSFGESSAFNKRLLAGAAALLLSTQAHGALIDSFDPATPGSTASQVGAAPGPTITAGGPTGNFLRLMSDGVNGQNNHYAYTRTDIGAFTKVSSSFDFRSGGAGDNADGFAYLLLPTAAHGISGAGFTGFTAEEPNVANTFAVGFDSHPAATVNDVSVHFGTERSNVTVPTGILTLDNQVFHRAVVVLQHVTGGAYASVQIIGDINGTASPNFTPISTFIAGLNPYENRAQFSGRTGGLDMSADIDNVNVNYSNDPLPFRTIQDFDGEGTPMHFQQNGTAPGPIILSGGPNGRFLRLVNDGVTSNSNSVVFAATESGLLDGKSKINASFDFRITDGTGPGRADGFSMLLLPTATFGTNGVGATPVAEEPNVAGVIAIGFDVHPNENDASLHFGSELINVDLSTGNINLSSGQFHHAELVLELDNGQVFATLLLTPDISGVAGPVVTVFADQLIPGLTDLYDYRIQFAGRTGGDTIHVDIDNVIAFSTVVPEPATAMLSLASLAALAARRRRQA